MTSTRLPQARTTQSGRRVASRNAFRLFEGTWIIVVLLLVWWILSADSDNVFLPPLSSIFEALWRDLRSGVVADNAAFSLANLLLGLLIATVLAVVLGLRLGETRVLREILDPIIHFFRSIPKSALVPLIIGAFGIGAGPKVFNIAFACFWPILLNTIDGVRGVEINARRMARVYRIPRRLYFRRVVLPGALPQIVAGVRVALPIGITVMVVSELFAAERGLGYYILASSARFLLPETWAGALVIGIIGWLLSLIFSAIERRILRWYFKSGAK